MLSPSSVKQIPDRSSLQLQLLSRIIQVWLPVRSRADPDLWIKHGTTLHGSQVSRAWLRSAENIWNLIPNVVALYADVADPESQAGDEFYPLHPSTLRPMTATRVWTCAENKALALHECGLWEQSWRLKIRSYTTPIQAGE